MRLNVCMCVTTCIFTFGHAHKGQILLKQGSSRLCSFRGVLLYAFYCCSFQHIHLEHASLQTPPSCARLAVSCPLIRIRKQCKSNSEAHLTQNTQQLASHARRVFSTSVCTRNRLGHRAHVVQGTAGGDGGGGQVHVLCIAKTHMRQWQQQCELLWTGLTVCGCEECVLCLANKYTHSISSGVSYCRQKKIGCAGQQDPWTQVDCYNRPGHAPSYALYMTVCIVIS